MHSYFVIGCYVAAFSALLSGLYVFFGNRKKDLNKVYFLFSLVIFLWSASLASAVSVSNPEIALLLFRVEHAAVVFLPTVYLHMVLVLIGAVKKHRRLIYGTYIWSIGLFILNAAGFLVKNISPKFYFPYYKEPGAAYPALLLLFIFGALYGHYLLFKKYKKSSGYQRNRFKLFFGSSVVGFTGGLPTFLPLYDINPPPYVMYVTPAFYFIFAYAIIQIDSSFLYGCDQRDRSQNCGYAADGSA